MMKRSFLLEQAAEETAHETPVVSGISARLSALKSALSDPSAVANHAAELEASKAESMRLSGENATLKAENERLKQELGEASAEIEKITATLSLAPGQAPAAALEKKVAERTADTVASLGVPVEALPTALPSGSDVKDIPMSQADLEKAMEGKSFSEQRAMLLEFQKRKATAKLN